jgi:hypothetical protein
MLDLVKIFLITLSAAFIAVRFYRAVDGWQGFRQPLVGQQNKPSKISLKAQLGFISLIFEPKQKGKTVRLRSATNGVKAPWGW